MFCLIDSVALLAVKFGARFSRVNGHSVKHVHAR
jgi:hypothetical protein